MCSYKAKRAWSSSMATPRQLFVGECLEARPARLPPLKLLHSCRDGLYEECLASLDAGRLLEADDPALAGEALRRAFNAADAKLLEWLDGQEGSAWQSGSTAAVAFVRRDRIFVASCGDSRVVLAAGDDVHELVDDHRPTGGSDAGVAEAARVKDAGGWVSGGRVCGSLAVSRAFGDVEYKAHHRRSQAMKAGITKGRWTSRFISKLRLDEDWVVVEPSVHAAHLPSDAELVIVASDGLWDSMSSSEAVRFAKEKLAEHGDLERVCQALVQYSLVDRQGQDNVSVALIKLS
eukprot:SM000104S09369  [mRNA]  locus=s104:396623:398815:- [translate_table: standard]